MVNILLEGYDIAAPWLQLTLSHYLKPTHKVAVVAFSFRASRVKCAADWASLYGRCVGRLWVGIVGGFAAYGIAEENVDYFTDTAEQDASIRRVLAEHGKPVYATASGASAIVVEDGKFTMLDDVRVFGEQ